MNYTLIEHKPVYWEVDQHDGSIIKLYGPLEIHFYTANEEFANKWAELSLDDDLELEVLIDGAPLFELTTEQESAYDQLFDLKNEKLAYFREQKKLNKNKNFNEN